MNEAMQTAVDALKAERERLMGEVRKARAAVDAAELLGKVEASLAALGVEGAPTSRPTIRKHRGWTPEAREAASKRARERWARKRASEVQA